MNILNLNLVGVKMSRKYLALIYLSLAIPIVIFLGFIFLKIILFLYIFFMYDDFYFSLDDIAIILKISFLGIPAGIAMWYLECRRLGIKIFGK